VATYRIRALPHTPVLAKLTAKHYPMTMPRSPKRENRPTPAMSFRTYVRRLPREVSPAGDFIAGAKADKNLPEIPTWKDLRSYLHKIGAPDTALIAARSVWRRYKILQREHSKDA